MDLPPGLRDRAALARSFRRARPFPHLVLDGFLEPGHARALLSEFPPYDVERFRSPYGHAGKAVYPRVRELGPAFRRLDALARSRRWLAALSEVAGIADLRYDPRYDGGGAQENREGMRLWPHVDFNYRHSLGWRRLNLLLYLNPGWKSWQGGRLALHQGPRSRPSTRIEPRLNRCVIFETSERSWHSVEPVRGKDSRRSVSLYFYTDRPPRDPAPPHSTIWAFPALPAAAREGSRLDAALRGRIERALALRDIEIVELARGAAPPGGPPPPPREGPLLPRAWKAGRRLSAADAAWLRRAFAERQESLERCWRPWRR